MYTCTLRMLRTCISVLGRASTLQSYRHVSESFIVTHCLNGWCPVPPLFSCERMFPYCSHHDHHYDQNHLNQSLEYI